MNKHVAKGCLIAFLDGMVFFIFIMGLILYSVGVKNENRTSKKAQDIEKCTEYVTVTITHVNEFWEPVNDSNGNRLDIEENHRSKFEGRYEYVVDGKEYEGRKVSYSSIKEGDSLEIAYNPNDPSMHYTKDEINKIKRQSGGNSVSGFFTRVGLLLMVIAFLMAVPLAIYNKVTRIKQKREHERIMREIDEKKKEIDL